jgi:SpoIID/LytB domain protein
MSRRAWIVVLSTALVIAGNTFGHPTAQAAAELRLRGHGWGHGRGMGQYGALGYAVDYGWTTAQILDHYYGGTSAGSIATDTPVSVRFTAQDNLSTIVVQERGHLLVNGAQPPNVAVRVDRVAANAFQLYDGPGCGGPWTARGGVATGPIVAAPHVQNEDRTEMLQLCEATGTRWLRGTISAVEGESAQRTVNSLGLDNYVRGVVPRESPASWADLGGGKGMQALQAQAVAARSYGATEARYSYAKTCETIYCQVYRGRAETVNGTFRELEDSRSNAAVANTAGQVRRFGNGSLARTEFSSSTGGYTAGGTFPAVPDAGDATASNPNHTWETAIPAATLEKTYGKGTFISAEVTSRNGLGEDGGRVNNLLLHFSGGDVNVTGNTFQATFALKSNWFTPTSSLTFHGWESLGGPLTSGPASTSWAGGRIDVFAQGPNNALVHKWFDGQWRGLETLPGTITSAPAVSSQGLNRLDVFARGTDNGLWVRSFNNAWAPDWTPLGGAATSAPASASWAAGRIDLFVRGTDNALWHRWYDGGWSGWESLGGGLTSAPAVASWSPGRLDVFIKGTDNALWHRWYDGSWKPWESLGGGLTSAPAAAAWGVGRLDVFVRGTNNGLWQTSYENGWAPYISRGGTLTSDPAASSWGPQRLDIFARGTDNALWHAWEL